MLAELDPETLDSTAIKDVVELGADGLPGGSDKLSTTDDVAFSGFVDMSSILHDGYKYDELPKNRSESSLAGH